MNTLTFPSLDTAASEVAPDSSRPFLPEVLTPLFYTDAYRLLSAEQRLRYGQLHLLYLHEQIVFFEQSLACNVLGPLRARLRADDPLRDGLAEFLQEECEHSAVFLRFNRLAAPELYRGRKFCFLQTPGAPMRLLQWAARRPGWFPVFLWMMMLQEERALFLGREIVRREEQLDARVVEIHRVHLADEAGHVRWDEALLDRFWPGVPRWRRTVNARLLGWMAREFFSFPTRAGQRVVAQLLREFPTLEPHAGTFADELRGLRSNRTYRRTLYSRAVVPRTLARCEKWPEFHCLQTYLPGYTFADEQN